MSTPRADQGTAHLIKEPACPAHQPSVARHAAARTPASPRAKRQVRLRVLHEPRRTAHDSNRQPSAERLAVAHNVGTHPEILLRTAERQAEASGRLIENERDARGGAGGAEPAQPLAKLGGCARAAGRMRRSAAAAAVPHCGAQHPLERVENHGGDLVGSSGDETEGRGAHVARGDDVACVSFLAESKALLRFAPQDRGGGGGRGSEGRREAQLGLGTRFSVDSVCGALWSILGRGPMARSARGVGGCGVGVPLPHPLVPCFNGASHTWATPSVQPCALPPKTSSIGRPVLSRARSTAVFSASLPLTWKRACALREIAHSTEALCEASSEATEAPPASPTPMAGSGATPPATEWTPQRGNIPSDPLPDSTSETISHALPEPAATGSASLVCALPR
eukprot:scaffold5907_cov120-Isochrysis_galbana.AAC.14